VYLGILQRSQMIQKMTIHLLGHPDTSPRLCCIEIGEVLIFPFGTKTLAQNCIDILFARP
jgi:hypothetical protein